MNQTLDERARDASDALRAAAVSRQTADLAPRTRAPARMLVTAALLVIVVVVGAFLALRASSPRNGGLTNQPPSGGYRATAILITNGPTLSRSDARLQAARAARLRTDARLLRTGAVPRRARTTLHFAGTPAELVAELDIAVNPNAGTITLASRQSTGAEADRVVATFGRYFLDHFTHAARADYDSRVASQLRQEHEFEAQLAAATRQLNTLKAQGKDDVQLESEVRGLTSARRFVSQAVQEIRDNGPFAIDYRLIQPEAAVRVAASGHGSNAQTGAIALVVLLLVGGAGFALGRHRTARAT
jgi:hypothetical protein